MKTTYSLTGIKRWSCKSKEVPGIANIKSIHVYDFDNTLFSSPLPNPQIWTAPTIGMLQAYEAMAYGGWWHDVSVLTATGDGLEKEEPKAWEGWWNETIVELVKISMEQKDVCTVLLTGRSETNFSDIVNRICNAKGLDFDFVVLKPEVGPSGQQFDNTMLFKQEFLKELVFTYKNADEIRIYEDRPKHVKGFREYFERLNKSFLSHPVDQPPPPRKPITAEVIHVCELKSALNPEAEIEVVQRAINRHNHAIATGGPNPYKAVNKKLVMSENFLYFGYLINQNDSARLITLCNTPPHLIDSGEVRFMASSILIAPFYPRQDIIRKAGGRGKKVTWQITGIAKFEDRIWAARVAPVTETQVHTQDPTPVVVLAIRKGSRAIDASKIQNWQPVAPEKAFMFETTVGDKVMLKIEPQEPQVEYYNHVGKTSRQRADGDGGFKRKYGQDDDFRGKENYNRGDREDGNWTSRDRNSDRHGQARYFSQGKQQFNNRGNRNQTTSGRRNDQNPEAKGSNNTRPRGGGQNNRGRGVNRPPGYKSLDDYGPGSFDGASDMKSSGGGGDVVMNY